MERVPLSHRYFRASFKGFLPRDRNKLETFTAVISGMLKAIIIYVKAKINLLSKLLYALLITVTKTPQLVKDYVVTKLIWSRGRLGRRVAPLVVFAASFLVFIFGEILSSSTLVSSPVINPDYVTYVSDIVPQKYIATTLVPDDRKRTEAFIYVVEGGDTISGIGAKFKISKDALQYVNNLTDYSVLKVGQELTIPPISGLIHTVASGDTLSSIAAKYDVAPQAVSDFNYILDTSSLAVGSELVIPGASVPVTVPAYIAPVTSPAPGTTQRAVPNNAFCVWPTTVRIITQYFYWYHNGLDIATPWSGGMPPLFSCTSGVVTRAGWDPFGLGLHVKVDHGNGYETTYGHMSRIDVGYGERVGRGQTIGLMGNTGNSSGPHVHFIVKYNGVAQNPLSYTR